MKDAWATCSSDEFLTDDSDEKPHAPRLQARRSSLKARVCVGGSLVGFFAYILFVNVGLSKLPETRPSILITKTDDVMPQKLFTSKDILLQGMDKWMNLSFKHRLAKEVAIPLMEHAQLKKLIMINQKELAEETEKLARANQLHKLKNELKSARAARDRIRPVRKTRVKKWRRWKKRGKYRPYRLPRRSRLPRRRPRLTKQQSRVLKRYRFKINKLEKQVAEQEKIAPPEKIAEMETKVATKAKTVATMILQKKLIIINAAAGVGAMIGEYGADKIAEEQGWHNHAKQGAELAGAVLVGALGGAAGGAVVGAAGGGVGALPGAVAGFGYGAAVAFEGFWLEKTVDEIWALKPAIQKFVDNLELWAFGQVGMPLSYDDEDNLVCVILLEGAEPVFVYTFHEDDPVQFVAYWDTELNSRNKKVCVSAGQKPTDEFRLKIYNKPKLMQDISGGISDLFAMLMFDKKCRAGDKVEIARDGVKLIKKAKQQQGIQEVVAIRNLLDDMCNKSKAQAQAKAKIDAVLSRVETSCTDSFDGYDHRGETKDDGNTTLVKSQTACKIHCAAKADCRGWTWKKDSQQCWLKRRVLSTLYPNKNSVSGYCVQMTPSSQVMMPTTTCSMPKKGKDNNGTTMGDPLASPDWHDCRAHCAAKHGCKQWTWREDSNQCKLKNTVGTNETDDNLTVSGACIEHSPYGKKMRNVSTCGGPTLLKDNGGENLNAGMQSVDWKGCRLRCERLWGWCRGWTWKADSKQCWLKSKVLNRSVSDNRSISGACNSIEPSPTSNCSSPGFAQGSIGSLLHGHKIHKQDWFACRALCETTPECKGWTWRSDSSECWLRRGAIRLTSDRRGISGHCHCSWCTKAY